MKISCGLVAYTFEPRLHVLIVRPGNPINELKYKKHGDDDEWSIPKGVVETDEDYFSTAKREFEEEIGIAPPKEFNNYNYLGTILQKNNKLVHAWSFKWTGPLEFKFKSNKFKMEWPKGSGKIEEFDEIDRAQFFPYEKALNKIKESQQEFLIKVANKVFLGS